MTEKHFIRSKRNHEGLFFYEIAYGTPERNKLIDLFIYDSEQRWFTMTFLNGSYTGKVPIYDQVFWNRLYSWEINPESLVFSHEPELRFLGKLFINTFYPENSYEK